MDGTLVAASYSIECAVSLTWTLKALIVTVLGGLESITGTLVGGLLLGLTESATSLLISNSCRQVVSLILYILILIFRPQGLFGVKESRP